MIVRLTTLVLLFSLAFVPVAQADKPTAAVMPLGKGAGGAQYDGLGRALADMMVTDLSSSNVLQLVERMQLGLILDELKLSKSGYLDKKTAQKLGRGLGAEFVITGSFSVVESLFIIDTHIIKVESGSIIKAARSEGPVSDFVAIEKDVVEKLLAGLQVKLSPVARRKLLLDSPTESATALASYGRGILANEDGHVAAARKSFEEALRKDPDFAKASLALRDLATAIEEAGIKERKHRQDNKQRGLDAALRILVAETTRPANFKDTRDTLMDFAIREQLLGRAGRHCQRYAELKHFLLRKQGIFEPWFDGLAGRYQDSYRMGEGRIEKRATQLGIAGPHTLYGSDARRLLFRSALSSGRRLLLFNNMTPEKFGDTLVGVLVACHPPSVQLGEFEQLARHAKRWGWIDKPLFSTYNIGPSTVTARDSIDLTWAYFRASHRGVDRKVRTRTDAVLARHPEGDADRSLVISRIKTVVGAGQDHEKRVAARMGLTEAAIVSRAKLVLQEPPKRVHASVLCAEVMQAQHGRLLSAWAKYEAAQKTGRQDRRQDTLDRLGMAIGPVHLAGCFRVRKKAPLGRAQIVALTRRGLGRPHPEALKDVSCLQQTSSLKNLVQTATSPRQLTALLVQLQSLRQRRCLLP